MDVVLKEEDGLTVLDFKTDLVEKKSLNSKLEHYKPQARVYSDAIKTIFGKPPEEVMFFFLHLMQPVSVIGQPPANGPCVIRRIIVTCV
jgi:ATP-dependent helicase/nuclease subunit A